MAEVRVERSPKEREHALATMALAVGCCMTALTVVMCATANSVALYADLVASITDTIAVLAAWLVVRAARRGQKESYHFGYGRLETFTSFGMGQLMLLSAAIIAGMAVWKLFHPSELHGFGVYLSLGSNVVFGAFNRFVCVSSRRLERLNESPTLKAQRRLYNSKFLSNIILLVAFSLAVTEMTRRWSMYIDPALSILIAVELLLSATKTMGWSALNLVDRSMEEQEQILVLRGLAEHFYDYVAIHGVRTRRAGTRRYIELYLEFEPERPMGEVQDIIERLQTRISELIEAAEVTIIPSRSAPGIS